MHCPYASLSVPACSNTLGTFICASIWTGTKVGPEGTPLEGAALPLGLLLFGRVHAQEIGAQMLFFCGGNQQECNEVAGDYSTRTVYVYLNSMPRLHGADETTRILAVQRV